MTQMNPIFGLIFTISEILFYIILTSVIFSWLAAFGIINMRNTFIARIYQALNNMTEPMYAQIRKVIPTNFGGVDIAPIGVILGIQFIQQSLIWISRTYGI